MIRIYLRIQRNDLPAVDTVWPILDTQQRNTICQLLEQVNVVFPLEAEHWGLDHYTVTIGGYECLHFHELGTVLQDGDEVVIKPMGYADVRARTLLGRDQITEDGRRLMDGVSFGRPFLKRSSRPEVRIPPPKRQRLLEGEEDGDAGHEIEWEDQDGAKHAMVLFNRDEELDEDDDSEGDEDFQVDGEDEEDCDTSSDDGDDDESSAVSTDDNSSGGDGNSTSHELSSDSDSDSSSSDGNPSDESWEGIEASDPKSSPAKTNSTPKKQAATNGNADAAVVQSHKRKTDEGQEDDKNVKKVKAAGIPFQGINATKQRNTRRRDQKKLKHLKSVGLLPPDADMAALHAFEGTNTSPAHASELENQSLPGADKDASNAREMMEEPLPKSTKPEKQRQQKPAEKDSELEERRQELLRAIAAGGVEVTNDRPKPKRVVKPISTVERPASGSSDSSSDSAPSEHGVNGTTSETTKATDSTDGTDVSVSTETKKTTQMVPASVARRAKLDLAGSNRLLFGSLGVRVPKTQAEKDALQQRLAGRVSRNANAPVTGTDEPVAAKEPEPMQEVVSEEPANWWDKLDLSAVECIEEGIELSTPPFPFYQRWDPQQRRARGNSKKKRKRNGHLVETYDKYNKDGSGDALNYDDDAEDEEYWEEGAFLNDDYEWEGEDDAAAMQLLDETVDNIANDGFPSLPSDISALPSLEETDALKDDFVLYTEMACSAATNWQPQMLTRTVQLQSKDDDGWIVLQAQRDMPPREYDDDGNRVYSKFEMEGVSDNEDEDDGRAKTVQWSELIEPKLLKRGEASV